MKSYDVAMHEGLKTFSKIILFFMFFVKFSNSLKQKKNLKKYFKNYYEYYSRKLYPFFILFYFSVKNSSLR